ncbi:hypothetical protein [Morganella psychrotolerans]|uniref:Uncharacterized protein n=1 Tax=Morganella psychrotolerans TaxID=368603 RepID=A0A1B8HSV0_9GAMM|nr:hypothetical protein [Morganella psychrotolerans]OBU12526.1 hypothetical protein AYY18_15445 [Morganella psychrotolerans]
MSKILQILAKAILRPATLIKGTVNDINDHGGQQEINTKDKFFVNPDGSISLNPNSEAVQKAFAANIEKLKSNSKE